MNNDKPIVTNGIISIVSSDGNEMTLGFSMPEEIASRIIKDIMGWRENWGTSFEQAAKYFEVEKEFTSKPKQP